MDAPSPSLDAPSNTTPARNRTTKNDSSAPVRATKSEGVRSAHFVLQGKGGTGKSLIAALIAQYLGDKDRLSGCYDTDPVNHSLQTIEKLAAKPIELLNRNAINVKNVDRLVESVLEAKKETVIDNGAASFLPLSRYLVENDIAGFLDSNGVRMFVHTVVTGGGNGLDTLRGMKAAVEHFTPAAKVVVWVNEYFGPTRFENTEFENTQAYRDVRENIHALVYLRKLDPEMWEPVLLEMLERKLTFAEALNGSDFMTLERSRLFRIRNGIWDQLDAAL
jgi:hypothetical protein